MFYEVPSETKISIIDREKYFDMVNFEVTYKKIKGKKIEKGENFISLIQKVAVWKFDRKRSIEYEFRKCRR